MTDARQLTKYPDCDLRPDDLVQFLIFIDISFQHLADCHFRALPPLSASLYLFHLAYNTHKCLGWHKTTKCAVLHSILDNHRGSTLSIFLDASLADTF